MNKNEELTLGILLIAGMIIAFYLVYLLSMASTASPYTTVTVCKGDDFEGFKEECQKIVQKYYREQVPFFIGPASSIQCRTCYIRMR